MFVDQADVLLIAGNGGNGCSAFARRPFSRFARPTGGDGGDGGDVILVADSQLSTLLDFQFRHEFRAGRGRHGSGNTRKGKRGEDRLIRVPVGTVVSDAQTRQLLRDLVAPGERLVVARGGRAGLGNGSGPRATPGELGERRQVRLELKLIADVGIVGLPNAGKSSLLSHLSSAKSKIAPYPFTTRNPVLGVVPVDVNGSFVACDIPGLIEGAHQGRGLGTQFLRHIERTRLLLHLIDMAAVDGRDPVQDFATLNEELTAYSPALGMRPQVVVANKMDLPAASENLTRFQTMVGVPVVAISCATKVGLPQLVRVVWQRLQAMEPLPQTSADG